MIAALFSVLLLTSDSAAASATPQAPDAAAEAPKQEKICKRQPVTGQLKGTKRVCMTAEQWKASQAAAMRPKR